MIKSITRVAQKCVFSVAKPRIRPIGAAIDSFAGVSSAIQRVMVQTRLAIVLVVDITAGRRSLGYSIYAVASVFLAGCLQSLARVRFTNL